MQLLMHALMRDHCPASMGAELVHRSARLNKAKTHLILEVRVPCGSILIPVLPQLRELLISQPRWECVKDMQSFARFLQPSRA